MKTLLGILTGFAALAFFSGCVATTAGSDNRTSRVNCNYARQQTLPPKGEAKTYAFDTDSKAKGTAAYESYCRQVAETLDAYGWRQLSAEDKDATVAADYWVTVVYGYALDDSGNVGAFQRITAASMVGDQHASGTDYYANVAAYYAALSITTKPQGGGDTVFLAQIIGSSAAQMPLVLPTLFKQLLKDFPGENVKDGHAVLHTRR